MSMILDIGRRLFGWLPSTRLDEHTRLVRKGRDFYVYEERGRSIELQIDMLSGHPQRVIYPSTMVATRDPANSSIPLDVTEQRRIAARIADHLRAQGYSVEVED